MWAGGMWCYYRISDPLQTIFVTFLHFLLVDKYITISLGVTTTIPTISSHSNEFISKADKALYFAKKEVRNCVRFQP